MNSRDRVKGLQALVLAAGRSTRLAGELDGRSKLLVDIGGQSVLERNLRWIASAGIADVWINLHHRPDDVRALIGDGSQVGVRVRYSEEPELLGTAGALRKIAFDLVREGRPLREPILVVYGDNVNNFDLSAMVARHLESPALATIALFDTRVHDNSGIAGGRVIVRDTRVIAFAEGTSIESTLVNAAVYVLDPRIVDFIPAGGASDFGRDVFPAALAAGERITAHVIERNGYCFGIDTPAALARTRAALAAGASAR